MENEKLPFGYWNDYDNCFNAAKKCSCSSEFASRYPGGYDKARVNGWLKDYTWFSHPEPHRKYTREYCETVSKQYETLKEFMNSEENMYNACRKNGWLKDFVWLKRERKPHGYWMVYENNYNEALKYAKKSQFSKKSGSAYNVAKQNGWLETYTWLKDERLDIFNGKIDSVYVYEFSDYNTAYIGRTLMRLQKRRDKEHIFSNDCVARFAKENNIPVPEMKILEQDLTLNEGVEKEAFYIERYKNDGWNVLNKAKAGAIGTINLGKYTRQKCYDEAAKYEYYLDFMKNAMQHYRVAYREGWIDDYTWLKRTHVQRGTWTYDECFLVASECETVEELKKEHGVVYAKACNEGWIYDYTWLDRKKRHNKFWDKETCRDYALLCSSRTEFQKRFKRGYYLSLINGWLDEFDWFPSGKKPKDYWTYEHCREASLECQTVTEYRKKFKGAYCSATKNNWLHDFEWLYIKYKARNKQKQEENHD
jgi:hypothetical protein